MTRSAAGRALVCVCLAVAAIGVAACSTADGGFAIPEVEAADVRLEWPSEDHAVRSIDLVAQGEDGTARRVSSSALFGLGPADAPFSTADLLVASFAADGGSVGLSGDEIELRSGIGYRDQALADYTLPDAVSFYEDELAVIVASRSMSFEELVAIAEALVVDGALVTLDATPMPQLAASDRLAWDRGGDWWLGYETAANPEISSVSVSGRPGGSEESLLWRYAFGGSPVEVRGTDGWLSTFDATDAAARTVHWIENGNIVRVRSIDGEPVAVADDLIYGSLDRWEELAAEVEDR